jgi:hypothetical protein
MKRLFGRSFFLTVVFILCLMIADGLHAGSHRFVGALLGFAGFTAFIGGSLSALLDRLFLTQMLGARRSLVVSCVAIWALVLAYLLTLPSDGVDEHGPVLLVLGATTGMCIVFWFRRRRLERAAATLR